MAVTIEDIKKLRTMTGAGMKDCKKALAEADGDINKAVELVRERGLAIAAKRSARTTSNGCILVKNVNGFAAMIALKCETDFVANGADYIELTQEILDAAIAAKAQTLDEVNALALADGTTVAEAVTRRSGVVGEKMELDGYNVLEGENIYTYDHMGRHTLALDESSVSQEVKDEELRVAIQKTKEEQIERQVNVALKKAGINANLVDSEDHIASNITKGWLSQEDADKAIEIKKTVSEQAAANLNENMIQNIAQGRMAKFFKENCLVDQEFQFGDGDKESVSQWLSKQGGLTIRAYKRFGLAAD